MSRKFALPLCTGKVPEAKTPVLFVACGCFPPGLMHDAVAAEPPIRPDMPAYVEQPLPNDRPLRALSIPSRRLRASRVRRVGSGNCRTGV